VRFGLVGTGHWARVAHAPALASTDGITFSADWGRSHAAAHEIAAEFGVTAHDDLDDFLGAVDAVAFSVPPDVQAPIAAKAARAGKHLLLEKPVALSAEAADTLVSAVEKAGVASVVFFTMRFQPEVRAWLAEVTAQDGWLGGTGIWLGGALRESNPFNTPWRREKGGLWDAGPHVLSLLWECLGPINAVTAVAGPRDITHLVLRHPNATSTVTVTVSAPEQAAQASVDLWGEPGTSSLPRSEGTAVTALRTALSELAANAATHTTAHPCDVWFGRDIVRVLDAAQRQLNETLDQPDLSARALENPPQVSYGAVMGPLAGSAAVRLFGLRDDATRDLATQAGAVAQACHAMAVRFHRGGKLIVFGTGGSSTDAQHVAVEFVHPVIVGKRALPAISLTADVATVTGIAEQRGIDAIFAHQIRYLASPEDIALGIGDGKSVRAGLREAADKGLLTIALTGNQQLDADHVLTADSDDPRIVKEVQVTTYHILWELVHVFFEQPGILGPEVTA
jgi:predicted dehydrogenase/phosphoheptose isomerase